MDYNFHGRFLSIFSARIGGILCPYLNMVADYWRPGPLIVYGILAFSAGILSLLLPETLNKKLPETIEDGERFGKEQTACSCLSFGKDKSIHQPKDTTEIALDLKTDAPENNC